MARLLAVAFEDPRRADEVLLRLRGLARAHLVDLEDAAVVQRDRHGRLHLKQVLGRHHERHLPEGFWARLVGRLLPDHHDHRVAREVAAELGLPEAFVTDLARRLAPGTSALLVLVEPHRLEALVRAFEGEGGHVLAADLPAEVRRELEEAMAGRWLPTARELYELAEQSRLARQRARRQRESAEERRRRWIEQLRQADLSPELVDQIRRTVLEAAHRGEFRALIYRFPSELLSDRGRRVIQQEPDWPETLVGQPRRLYEWYLRELAPRGLRLEARLLDWRDHLPGDVGLVLRWDHPHEAAAVEESV